MKKPKLFRQFSDAALNVCGVIEDFALEYMPTRTLNQQAYIFRKSMKAAAQILETSDAILAAAEKSSREGQEAMRRFGPEASPDQLQLDEARENYKVSVEAFKKSFGDFKKEQRSRFFGVLRDATKISERGMKHMPKGAMYDLQVASMGVADSEEFLRAAIVSTNKAVRRFVPSSSAEQGPR